MLKCDISLVENDDDDEVGFSNLANEILKISAVRVSKKCMRQVNKVSAGRRDAEISLIVRQTHSQLSYDKSPGG